MGKIYKSVEDDPIKRANLELRSMLMIKINKKIKKSGLTQIQAAELLKIKQTRCSDLMTDKIDKFSIEYLVNCANRLGLNVQLTCTDKKNPTKKARR